MPITVPIEDLSPEVVETSPVEALVKPVFPVFPAMNVVPPDAVEVPSEAPIVVHYMNPTSVLIALSSEDPADTPRVVPYVGQEPIEARQTADSLPQHSSVWKVPS
jgi:hypothetical protein